MILPLAWPELQGGVVSLVQATNFGFVAYRQAVTNIAGHFKGYQVDHINRRHNEAADALSRRGS